MKKLLLAILLGAPATPVQIGSVAGRLLSAEGIPAAKVRVALSSMGDGSLLGIVQTDAEGRYRMDQVPAGRYYIAAGLVEAPTYFPGVKALSDAIVVTVTSGTALEIPDFRVATNPGLRISGRVESETVPLDRTGPLIVQLTSAGLRASAPVAPDGVFEFSGLPPGNHSVIVTPNVTTSRATIVLGDQDILDLRLRVRVITDEMIATAVSQAAGTKPIRVGDVAQAFSERDIAAIALALPAGQRPWLLNGYGANAGGQVVEVYLPPDTATNDVRRGTAVMLIRRAAERVWTIQDSRGLLHLPARDQSNLQPGQIANYAQVVVAGRGFEDFQGEQDMNRPFAIAGQFDDSTLISLAAFVRGNQPIVSVVRLSDDSVRVVLRRETGTFNWLTLRWQGQTWVILQRGFQSA